MVRRSITTLRAKLFSCPALLMSAFCVVGLESCMSARDGRVLQKDIFEVNTRLITLENQLKKTGEVSEESSKKTNLRQANSTARLDKMERDIQQVKGDIDSLKVGVKTGKLPGSEGGEVSVGSLLEKIEERLVKLEETQMEILEGIEKSASRRKKKTRKSEVSSTNTPSSEREAIHGIAAFRKAFQEKRYSHIVSDVQAAIKVNKGKIKQELYYFEAESLFKVGKTKDAAVKFSSLIDNYKNGMFITKARMRMGDCFRFHGDDDTALIYYKEALESKPSKEEARQIKEKISKLKVKKPA